MAHAPDTLSLVADVGGTNTRVALAEGTSVLTETVRRFQNSTFPDLESVLGAYVMEEDVDCAAAAVAVAGPVEDGLGTLTNLNWSIDREVLARVTRAERCAILNDLQAQAYALGLIAREKLNSVIEAPPAADGSTKLVIGVGTGFNAALALDTGRERVVPPSECGHVSMPIRTEETLRLGQFVETKHGFPSIEDVLSGRGLEHIHAWCVSESGATSARTASEVMEACAAGDALAERTVRIFVQLLGTVVGDLALVHLPVGGIFLIGGVTRAIAPHLARFGFAEAFRHKGRFSDFMDRFPVVIVEDDFAALTGLAAHLNDYR